MASIQPVLCLGSLVFNILLEMTLQKDASSIDFDCNDDCSLLECTIRELEKDCDTLENEANRLLLINNELRSSVKNGICTISDEFASAVGNEDSFAAELNTFTDSEVERPGPEGQEVPRANDDIPKISRTKSDVNERDRPRYTLYELEEVLNEKNKFKGT